MRFKGRRYVMLPALVSRFVQVLGRRVRRKKLKRAPDHPGLFFSRKTQIQDKLLTVSRQNCLLVEISL